MDYPEFENRLIAASKDQLPGQGAQYKMTPQRPYINLDKLDHSKVRHSAVAALFKNIDNRPHLILIQRNTYEGVHSGQISFPGGRWEKEDKNFQATALRETREEIGLHPKNVNIIRQLTPLYIPPSNFLVNVYTGILKGDPPLTPDPREVARILYFDFNLFLKDDVILSKEMNLSYGKFVVPVYQIDEITIWGATAMMISEMREIFMR